MDWERPPTKPPFLVLLDQEKKKQAFLFPSERRCVLYLLAEHAYDDLKSPSSSSFGLKSSHLNARGEKSAREGRASQAKQAFTS